MINKPMNAISNNIVMLALRKILFYNAILVTIYLKGLAHLIPIAYRDAQKIIFLTLSP
jgi:hypothetical protein